MVTESNPRRLNNHQPTAASSQQPANTFLLVCFYGMAGLPQSCIATLLLWLRQFTAKFQANNPYLDTLSSSSAPQTTQTTVATNNIEVTETKSKKIILTCNSHRICPNHLNPLLLHIESTEVYVFITCCHHNYSYTTKVTQRVGKHSKTIYHGEAFHVKTVSGYIQVSCGWQMQVVSAARCALLKQVNFAVEI